MKTLCLLFFLALFIDSACLASDTRPITTPMKFEGADTLSKFYHHNLFIDKKIKNQDRMLTPNYITDPRVIFSTYFGGNGYDCANSVTTDSQDNVYLVGYSGSTNLLTTEGAFQKEKKEGHDAFIAKFTKEGKALWITYLGGNRTDVAVDCICDENDNVIVLGKTDSYNFPTTDSSKYIFNSEVFIVKFDPNGKLLWSKLYGDQGTDIAEAMAKAENGNFVITGYTSGPSKLITDGAFQDKKTFGGWYDAFLTKLDTDGNIIWGTFLGGGQEDVAHGVGVDKEGNIAITGQTEYSEYGRKGVKFPVSDNAFQKDTAGGTDAFVAVFTKDGQLKWSTLYGGASKYDGRNYDQAFDVKFDNNGNVIFGGWTSSLDFPLSNDAYQKIPKTLTNASLCKFSPNGQRIWATYFGNTSTTDLQSIDIDSDNNIWFTGFTRGDGLPTNENSIVKIGSSEPSSYLAKFNPSGYPVWVSYYARGGDFPYKIIVKNMEQILTCGESSNFAVPVTKGAFQEDVSPLPSEYDGTLVSIDLNHTDTSEPILNNNIKIIYDNSYQFIRIFALNENEVITSIEISDLLGRTVLANNEINQQCFEIFLKDLPVSHSIYFLTITTNKRTVTEKFIY